MMKYVRARVVLAAISLLALGAAAGVMVDRMAQHHTGSPTDPLAAVQHDPLGAVDEAVGLRPEQRERVAAILEKRQAVIDEVWLDTHNRLQAALDSLVSEISAVLDPDQAEKFREAAHKLHGSGRNVRVLRLH